jgi:hypothetical protein
MMVRGLDLAEGLMSRMRVAVTAPADDPLYRVPENLEAFARARCWTVGPLRSEAFAV